MSKIRLNKIPIKGYNAIEQRVLDALTISESMRDDDDELLYAFWWNDLRNMGLDVYSISAAEILNMIRDGKLSSSSTILRARRKVQELVPATRGNKWMKRHKKNEEVKVEIVKQV